MILTILLASTSAPARLTNEILDGVWQQPCVETDEDVFRKNLEIKNLKWNFSFFGFEEPGCRKPYIKFEKIVRAAQTFEFGVQNVDLQIQDVIYTPLSKEVADALNLAQFCGFRNWQNQISISVLNRQCDSVANYRVGQIEYGIYSIDKENLNLKLGQADGVYDGSSKEKRFKTFEAESYQIQK